MLAAFALVPAASARLLAPASGVHTLTGAAVADATVTLYRSDSPAGPFHQLASGSRSMSQDNRRNPDLTDGAGEFGWSVVPGYYKVRASKAGCHAPADPSQAYVESSVLQVPPSTTSIDLALDCGDAPPPPVPPPPPTAPDPPPVSPPPPSDGATGTSGGGVDTRAQLASTTTVQLAVACATFATPLRASIANGVATVVATVSVGAPATLSLSARGPSGTPLQILAGSGFRQAPPATPTPNAEQLTLSASGAALVTARFDAANLVRGVPYSLAVDAAAGGAPEGLTLPFVIDNGPPRFLLGCGLTRPLRAVRHGGWLVVTGALFVDQTAKLTLSAAAGARTLELGPLSRFGSVRLARVAKLARASATPGRPVAFTVRLSLRAIRPGSTGRLAVRGVGTNGRASTFVLTFRS